MLAPSDREPPLDARDIRAALDRICATRTFEASPVLTRFLRFVVEATLRGQGGRLKGYTVAVEALGRRPDFDPQTDPIIRVEAIRLRASLARYYAGPGADDPIEIELPRGGYVPRFRWRARLLQRSVSQWFAAIRKLQRLLGIRVVLQLPPELP